MYPNINHYWTCSACTLNNSHQSLYCDACNLGRPQEGPVTAYNLPNSSSFPNVLRTFAENSISQISTAFRSSISTEEKIDYQPWVCQRCDFSNTSKRMFCELCCLDRVSLKLGEHLVCKKCNTSQFYGSLNPKCNRCQSKLVVETFGRGSIYPQLEVLQYGSVTEEENKKLVNVHKAIIEDCAQNDCSFIDDSFPHSFKSIQAETHRGGNLRDLVWLRPSDIYTIDGRQYRWSVLHDPKSSDIIQGHLGNCWFLSALAVIAERKELLEKIMITKVYQQNGVYLLYLCIDGLWQSILVDDFLPCDKNSRKQVFAQARKNQLWIPLIEKAFAKVYGSYGKLTAGRTIEGFSVLCGCPVKELDITSLKNEENGGLEMIWAKMASANEAGFLLGASCGSRSNADNSAEYKRVGLLSNHAYSLLDCIALPDGRRVLRVRNPWGGNFVWNQEWSEKWSGWTPELKNILKFKSNTNDGSFYMPFEAFCYYFDAVDIAKIRKNWKELRIPLKIENNWCSPNLQALKVIVTHDTEATFVLYQNESRKKPDNHDIFMLVHKEDSTHGGPGRLVAATSRKLAAFTSTDDIFLTAGIYFVTYFSFTKFSNNSPPLNGVVTIHSSKSMKASFTLVSPAFYHESLAVYVKKYGKSIDNGKNSTVYCINKKFSGVIVLAENYDSRKFLVVKNELKRTENLLSTRGSFTTLDVVPPNHSQFILLFSQLEVTQSYYLGYNIVLNVAEKYQLPQVDEMLRNITHYPAITNDAMAALHSPRRSLIL